MQKDMINLHFSDLKERGLYLYFPDSSPMVLTHDVIERTAAEFWSDPAKIPPEVKEAAELQRCELCPQPDKEGLCDCIRPVFPLLERMDKYVSYDKVTAVYVGDDPDVIYVSDTTMQVALSYVSRLSLIDYCCLGRKYWKYYLGIMPLDGDVTRAAARFYMNIYWLHKGNREEIDEIIPKMRDEIRITTQNQMNRLKLICKNDAFLNAYVHAQITNELISERMTDKVLQSHIDAQNTPDYLKRTVTVNSE